MKFNSLWNRLYCGVLYNNFWNVIRIVLLIFVKNQFLGKKIKLLKDLWFLLNRTFRQSFILLITVYKLTFRKTIFSGRLANDRGVDWGLATAANSWQNANIGLENRYFFMIFNTYCPSSGKTRAEYFTHNYMFGRKVKRIFFEIYTFSCLIEDRITEKSINYHQNHISFSQQSVFHHLDCKKIFTSS